MVSFLFVFFHSLGIRSLKFKVAATDMSFFSQRVSSQGVYFIKKFLLNLSKSLYVRIFIWSRQVGYLIGSNNYFRQFCKHAIIKLLLAHSQTLIKLKARSRNIFFSWTLDLLLFNSSSNFAWSLMLISHYIKKILKVNSCSQWWNKNIFTCLKSQWWRILFFLKVELKIPYQ